MYLYVYPSTSHFPFTLSTLIPMALAAEPLAQSQDTGLQTPWAQESSYQQSRFNCSQSLGQQGHLWYISQRVKIVFKIWSNF
jgi:hypothetical protein